MGVQNEELWAAVLLTSCSSGCVRCPWHAWCGIHGVDVQDDVSTHVLLVARDLIWGLGRHCDYPSGVKNSTRILCW